MPVERDVDLEGTFQEAGLSLASFDFTHEEQACISKKLKSMSGEERSQEQKIAIAISTCAPSKARGSMVATFSEDPVKIKIKGANYRAIDTGDGYFVLKNFPVMSTVKKGVKNAPKDYGQKELESLVRKSQEQYHSGPNFRCAQAFIRHNATTELGLEPEFSGYVLPNRVGPYSFGDETLPTIFADIKINKGTLDRLVKGELPFHSPEVNWVKDRITGLAFLATRPPHFEFANNTIGDIIIDHSAQFMANSFSEEEGAFEMKEEEKEEKVGPDKKKADKKDEKEAKMSESVDMTARFEALEESVKKISSRVDELSQKVGRESVDPLMGKPGNVPINPDGEEGRTKMELSPEFAAKFSALENDNAELKQWKVGMENQKVAAELVKKAESTLATKVVTDELRGQIASFAEEKAGKEGGKEWFDKYIEALKPSLRDKPSATFDQFAASGIHVEPTDETLVKFQGDPDKAEKAAQFAAEFRQLRKQSAMFGDSWGSNDTEREKVYIDHQFALLKNEQEGR